MTEEAADMTAYTPKDMEKATRRIQAVCSNAEFVPISYGRGLKLLIRERGEDDERDPDARNTDYQSGWEKRDTDIEITLFSPAWGGVNRNGKPNGKSGGPIVADIDALVMLMERGCLEAALRLQASLEERP